MNRIGRIASIVAAAWTWGTPVAWASPADGAAIFKERCAVCHGSEGLGQAGVYPPIAGTLGHFMAIDSGRQYLADVMLFGLGGVITVGGATYVGQMQVVPPLTDAEAADVLSYVLTALNAGSLPADARLLDATDIAARRADAMAPTAVAKSRQAVVQQLTAQGLSR